MNLLSLFSFVVYAAELIISPLPDHDFAVPTPPPITKPKVSFGQLTLALQYLPQVLGAATVNDLPEDQNFNALNTPSPTPKIFRKNKYTLAFLGDSMIDTLGNGLPDLSSELQKYYPELKFNLLNYGVGGTNIDYGIKRIVNDYIYLGKKIPSLISQKPDIVVIESFAYNAGELNESALSQHWLALAKAVDEIKNNLPETKIVIAATIAPNAQVFGDGAPQVNFTPEEKHNKTIAIKAYLDNAVRFAQSQNLPIADAYHPSLTSDGNGNLVYINAGDHIHYSQPGKTLFIQKITEAINDNQLLE